MRYPATFALILSLIMSAFGSMAQAAAAEQPKLLIMGEDADEDTIPRHNRIFNRVLAAIQASIQEYGFDVYDETAVSLDITNPNRIRRTDAELISLGKNIQTPPIDVMTVFAIYAAAQANPYADIQQLQVRVTGRLLQVQTGRSLGNFEVAVGPKGLKPLPKSCDRECVLERVGAEAKIVAKEVGVVLARRLDALAPPSSTATVIAAPASTTAAPVVVQSGARSCSAMSGAFTVVLQGFEGADLQAIEGMMVAFQGYESHKPVRTTGGFAEYWYETCSDRARLERNFRMLAEQLTGQNRVAMSGNRIEIERIPAPVRR